MMINRKHVARKFIGGDMTWLQTSDRGYPGLFSANLREMCGGQTGTETCFFPTTSFKVIIFPPALLSHSNTCRRHTINLQLRESLE